MVINWYMELRLADSQFTVRLDEERQRRHEYLMRIVQELMNVVFRTVQCSRWELQSLGPLPWRPWREPGIWTRLLSETTSCPWRRGLPSSTKTIRILLGGCKVGAFHMFYFSGKIHFYYVLQYWPNVGSLAPKLLLKVVLLVNEVNWQLLCTK